MPLDIGIGILLALGVSEAFGITLTPLFIGIGIGAALLPDIDLITALFGRWRHREVTHYPLVFVPLFILAFIFLPLPFATLFTFAVLANFIHDTIGIGWGIAWLWPFSHRKLLVFPEHARRVVLGRVVSWLPEEEPALRARTYPGSTNHWIRDFYFRPNLLAFIEYGVLVVALIALASYIW